MLQKVIMTRRLHSPLPLLLVPPVWWVRRHRSIFCTFSRNCKDTHRWVWLSWPTFWEFRASHVKRRL